MDTIIYHEPELSPSGIKRWYCTINGVKMLHRDDAPAYIDPMGSTRWYQHGERHRDDGPAEITLYSTAYYRHGELHRDDGPAVIRADGYRAWFIEGVFQYCEEPLVKSAKC